MKFGLIFVNTGMGSTPAGARQLAQNAEAAGFESLWTVEHVVVPSGYESKYPYDKSGKMAGGLEEFDLPDPLIWLTYAGAVTVRIKLGTGILILPQRNPLVLAKELATLDRLSGGRVELGIGIGWLREEFDALGVPWEHRGARTDEYVAAMRRLWEAPEVEFHGRFVDFAPVTCSPRPISGRIPIVVGGDTDAAIARAVRLADGWYPGESDPDRLRPLVDRFRAACDAADRDPAEIRLHVNLAPAADAAATHERIGRLAELGVSRVMVPAFVFAGPGGLDRMERFAADVVPTA